MKIRNDFVTNSSSSSFILAFKNKEDGIRQIAEELNYHPQALSIVLKDFCEAEPINLKEIKNPESDEGYYKGIVGYLESEASYELLYDHSGWHFTDSYFVKNWLKNHPDKESWDIFNSLEYKEAIKNLMDEKIKEFLDGIEGKEYVVELEYEDHTDIGNELEHEILPQCNFVYTSFNHH